MLATAPVWPGHEGIVAKASSPEFFSLDHKTYSSEANMVSIGSSEALGSYG
jgi:hypothetical protein